MRIQDLIEKLKSIQKEQGKNLKVVVWCQDLYAVIDSVEPIEGINTSLTDTYEPLPNESDSTTLLATQPAPSRNRPPFPVNDFRIVLSPCEFHLAGTDHSQPIPVDPCGNTVHRPLKFGLEQLPRHHAVSAIRELPENDLLKHEPTAVVVSRINLDNDPVRDGLSVRDQCEQARGNHLSLLIDLGSTISVLT